MRENLTSFHINVVALKPTGFANEKQLNFVSDREASIISAYVLILLPNNFVKRYSTSSQISSCYRSTSMPEQRRITRHGTASSVEKEQETVMTMDDYY